MEMKFYDGECGKFPYDSEQYKVIDGLLIYIGEETDGTKISIPAQITSCKAMFAGTDLKKAPTIPESVSDLSYAFKDCSSLEIPPIIPEGTENIDHMLEGCKSLIYAPIIPVGVESFEDTFLGCEEYIIHTGTYHLQNRGSRYEEGDNLVKYSGELGEFSYDPRYFELRTNSAGVEHLYYIGMDVDAYKVQIPNGLINAKDMFRGRSDITSVPVVPASVKITTNMFAGAGCHPLVQKYAEENIKERGVQHSVITIEDLNDRCLRIKKLENEQPQIQVRVTVPKELYERGYVIVLSSYGDMHYNGKNEFDSLAFIPGEKREVIIVVNDRPEKSLMSMDELAKLHNLELSRCKKIIEDVLRKSDYIESWNSMGEVPEQIVSKI